MGETEKKTTIGEGYYKYRASRIDDEEIIPFSIKLEFLGSEFEGKGKDKSGLKFEIKEGHYEPSTRDLKFGKIYSRRGAIKFEGGGVADVFYNLKMSTSDPMLFEGKWSVLKSSLGWSTESDIIKNSGEVSLLLDNDLGSLCT